MKMVPLGEFMPSRVPSLNPANFPDEGFELWSIPAFDSGEPERLDGSEIGSSKKCVEPEDVLLSRIVPHIRRSWVVGPRNGSRQIASGEWIIFRSSKFFPSYLRHVLISDDFHARFMQTVAGVGGSLLRARPEGVKEIEIPLPAIEEQKRIAAILDQADWLRRLRQRAIDRLNTLGQAIFYEMFGDPVTNPKGWKVSELGNLCEVVRGSSPRPQGDPAFFGGPVPRLMIADITRDGMRVTPSIDSLTEAGARRSRPMSAGSVVMAVSGAVGLPAILQVDACIHDGFVGFRSLDNRVVPEFLYQLLLVQREQNRAQGTGAIWVNLTTDQVKRFPVPLPSKEQQTLYLKKVASSYEASACCTAHSHYLEKLFSSLQHRAFRGEL
jgi:type I restriction enzyme S subunit